MFEFRRKGTVIAEGLKIIGSVTAEGLVEVNGQIEGELHCSSLIISPKAQVAGAIIAEKVIVDGRVEGPIQGGEVVLKSQAHVVGDIQHQTLAVEKGAYFEDRSIQGQRADGRQPDRVAKKSPELGATPERRNRSIGNAARSLARTRPAEIAKRSRGSRPLRRGLCLYLVCCLRNQGET